MKAISMYKKINEKNIQQIIDIAYKCFEIQDLEEYYNKSQKIEIHNAVATDDDCNVWFGQNVDQHLIRIFIRSHFGKSISFLLDTIAHEIAHNLFFDHSSDHKKVTKLLKIIIKCNLRLEGIIKF